jgi:HEPN domain-containing protein
MVRPGKAIITPRAEAKLYLAKAAQFLEEARSAAAHSRHDASMLNAIHAAISGADAVTVALAGRRSADPDHQRAVDLLEEVAGQSAPIRARARQLSMLLAKKNVVEYEARRATQKEMAEALERASRIIGWARDTVQQARL